MGRHEDLHALTNFLQQTRGLIGELVQDRDHYLLREFAEDAHFRGLLAQSWEEVAPRIDQVAAKLENPSAATWRKLQYVGLSGVQLELKMTVFQRLMERWRASGTSRNLARVLGHINTLLKSLSPVFTELDVVSEIKELLERLLKADRRPNRWDRA